MDTLTCIQPRYKDFHFTVQCVSEEVMHMFAKFYDSPRERICFTYICKVEIPEKCCEILGCL